MKRNLQTILIVFLLLAMASVAQGVTNLMEIGRSPFHKPPLKTSQELVDMVQQKQAEVERGFQLAGRSDLYPAFMEQIGKTQIDTVDFAKGSKFEWMFYKKNGVGTVKLARDVTWVNSTKSFSGFKFVIEAGGSLHTFVVPLGCGNVALMGSEVIPLPPPPPPNQSPTCAMTVSSVRAFCGEIITIDASGSADSDGDIAKMTIVFVDDQGQTVSEKVVDGTLVADVPMPCGATTLKVTVTDNDGVDATSPACSTNLVGLKRIVPIVDLGYYRQFDPANYLFGRVGIEYRFTEEFSILGLVGGAPQVEGIDGESAFLADVLAEYKFSRYFIDLGIGAWITDGDDDLETEDSDLDIIAAFGARVYGEEEGFNASVFLEVRSAVDEMDGLIDYGRFGLGVRFRF